MECGMIASEHQKGRLAMRTKKTVSLKSIAEACNVSTATVSRVLNNDPKVANETRERIMGALQESGYKGLSAVSDHAGPAVPKIGVILRYIQADYHLAIFLQIQKCLHEAGYETILFPLYPECDSATALNAVYQSDVSGIILVGCSYIALKSNLRAGFPHVWIDCEDAPDKTRGICRVESDHLVSGMLAAQELYRTGSVRPLIITQEKLSYRGMARIEGMRSEYKKHDISISDEQIIRVPVQGDGFTIVRDTVRYLITKGTSFDGIFCISDWRTLGAYTAVKQMGLRVPEDVRIVSFDGIARATHSVVNITAVAQNTELLARDACELLLHLIRTEGIPVRMIVVPTKIIAGATV